MDASLIVADAHRQRGVAKAEELPQAGRSVEEYLAVLDDAAFGGATPVPPKHLSPTDPAARWTASWGGPAVYAYCTNYLIDVEHAVIVDVEATTAVRQAKVGAAQTMIDRTRERFDLWPERLIADTGYGSAEMLNWLVNERGIEPHIPVFDKSKRTDGTFSREDFTYDHDSDAYNCPGGRLLQNSRRAFAEPRTSVTKADIRIYRASKRDCDTCPLKPRCCPGQPMRKIPRSIHKGARDMARDIAKTDAYATSRRQKKVEMLFAHLKRILKLGRLRLRGPCGARDEFLLAATAQNLRNLAKICNPAGTGTGYLRGRRRLNLRNRQTISACFRLTLDFFDTIDRSASLETYRIRTKPSRLHRSLPTWWWPTKNPSGSYRSLIASSRW